MLNSRCKSHRGVAGSATELGFARSCPRGRVCLAEKEEEEEEEEEGRGRRKATGKSLNAIDDKGA